MGSAIIQAAAAKARPIVDVADAAAHGITAVLDELKKIVDTGDLSGVGAAIDAAKGDVGTLVSAITEGTPAAASPQS